MDTVSFQMNEENFANNLRKNSLRLSRIEELWKDLEKWLSEYRKEKNATIGMCLEFNLT
jgi:hypothetical protein